MSQEAAKRQPKNTRQNQEETERRQNQGKRRKPAKNTRKQNKRNRGQASGKPLFDTLVESSDAESKVDQRLSGVPPWETQRECTNELIGSDLVEHEKLGKHP